MTTANGARRKFGMLRNEVPGGEVNVGLQASLQLLFPAARHGWYEGNSIKSTRIFQIQPQRTGHTTEKRVLERKEYKKMQKDWDIARLMPRKIPCSYDYYLLWYPVPCPTIQ